MWDIRNKIERCLLILKLYNQGYFVFDFYLQKFSKLWRFSIPYFLLRKLMVEAFMLGNNKNFVKIILSNPFLFWITYCIKCLFLLKNYFFQKKMVYLREKDIYILSRLCCFFCLIYISLELVFECFYYLISSK